MPTSVSSSLAAILAAVVPFLSASATPAPELLPPAIERQGWLVGPSSFTLEATATDEAGAAGLYLVHPLVSAGKTYLLAQAYGSKGDSNFGSVGGGLIIRHRVAAGRILEFSGMIAGLQDRDDFSYPEAEIGAAYIHGPITARVNGYLPFSAGDERPRGRRQWEEQLNVNGDTVHWSQELITRRSPGAGFDAEVELGLPHPPEWFDPRIAAGYFYRSGYSHGPDYSGAILRGELHFGGHWVAEAEWRGRARDLGEEIRFTLRFQTLFGRNPPDAASADAATLREQQVLYGPVEHRPWPTAIHQNGARSPFKTGVDHPAHADCLCHSDAAPLIFD